jgi:cytochrome c oxidase cbb3-type subunit 4
VDINDLRSVFTVLAILMFVGIVWWAYSDRRQQAYEEAAMLPLEDDAAAGMLNAMDAAQVTQNKERKSS